MRSTAIINGGSRGFGPRSRVIALLVLTALSFRAAGEPPSESPTDHVAPANSSTATQAGAMAAIVPSAVATPVQHGTSAVPAAPATNPLLVPEPAWSPRPQRARAVAPATPSTPATQSGASASTSATEPAQFASEAKWDLAGYNNDEVIYTIFITSQDPRIIRCTAVLNGFFYENGAKHSVSDRQSTTVFPQQRVQAGNWQGMDKQSGVNYSVKCHPV